MRSQTTEGSWAWQNARHAARAPRISLCCTCLRAVATASVNGAFPTNTPTAVRRWSTALGVLRSNLLQSSTEALRSIQFFSENLKASVNQNA